MTRSSCRHVFTTRNIIAARFRRKCLFPRFTEARRDAGNRRYCGMPFARNRALPSGDAKYVMKALAASALGAVAITAAL